MLSYNGLEPYGTALKEVTIGPKILMQRHKVKASTGPKVSGKESKGKEIGHNTERFWRGTPIQVLQSVRWVQRRLPHTEYSTKALQCLLDGG